MAKAAGKGRQSKSYIPVLLLGGVNGVSVGVGIGVSVGVAKC